MSNILSERAPKATAANTKKAPADPKPAPANLAFTARHADLLAAVEAAAALVAGSTSAFPVTQAVLLESAAGAIRVAAMSEDSHLAAATPATISSEGRALIPATTLAAALKALPSQDDVAITLDAHKATLKAGKASFRLLSLDADQYPLFKGLGPVKAQFVLAEHDAHRLLTGVAFALPRKDHRRILLGTFLEHMGGTTIRATATDGKQLARITVDAREACDIAWREKETRGIVAPKSLQDHARRVLDPKPPKKEQAPKECILTLHEDGACLQTRDAVFKVLAIGGKYPDCDQVIPRVNAVANVTSEALAAAARRGRVTADSASRSMVIRFDATELAYQSQSSDCGVCDGSFQISYEGEPCELAFNCDLLAEVLNSLEDGAITISMKSQPRTTTSGTLIPGRHVVKAPTIFTSPARKDALLLLMPIKLSDIEPTDDEAEE